MKVCTKCGVEKDESEFYKNQYRCKLCEKEYKKEYRKNNKEKIRQYRENNKDKAKQYREDNKDKIKERARKHYQDNRDYKKLLSKQYRENNSSYYKEYNKEYKIKNKDKRNAYEKNKRDNSSYYNFEVNLRSRIKQAFKLYSKNGKTKACKDYGIDFIAIFDKIGPKPEGNYHLDHIIPICYFDLDNPTHVRLAHLSENLRWITAEENLSKKDKIDMQLIRCSLALTLIAQEIGLI